MHDNQFMKVSSSVKYKYFSFVNVVTMPSIGSNNLKIMYFLHVINVYTFIRSKIISLKARQIMTGVRLRQICSLNRRRSTVCNHFYA